MNSVQKTMEIIQSFESGGLALAKAIEALKSETGETVDEYSLTNYWRSQSIEEFASSLCVEDLQNWETIDRESAEAIVLEMRLNVVDEAIQSRNGKALSLRYGKTFEDVKKLVYDRELTESQIVIELERDTRTIL